MTCNETLIRTAFECLRDELGRLDRRWRSGAPVYTIRSVVRSAEDFVGVMLDEVKLAPHGELSDDASMIVHDAYMRVLALADLLSEARDGKWADASEIDWAYDCALDLLDSLAPCASFADRALRQVTLEGIDLDDALRWIDDQLRVHAAS
jgi:hypothetical protein